MLLILIYICYRSAFFLFAQDERPKVKGANPNASIGDIGKELGAR